MNPGNKRNNLLIIDPLAGDKGHLLDDDLFWTSNLSRYYHIKLISSQASVKNIKDSVTDAEAKSYFNIFKNKKGSFLFHLKFIFRLLFINTKGFKKILFQSYDELSALIFCSIHPFKEIYLIVTNNLTSGIRLTGRKKRIMKYLFRAVRGIIIHSEYEKQFIRSHYSYAGDKTIKLAYHGIHDNFSQTARLKRISLLGAAAKERGIQNIEQIAKIITSNGIEFAVFGESAEYINSNDPFISKNPGYLNTEAYKKVFSSSLYIILPFTRSYEGRTSGIMCSCIASDTPFIAPNIEPFTELFLGYGEMGFLYDIDNINSLDRKIRSHTPQLWGTFAANMQKYKAANSKDHILCTLTDFIGK